MKLFTCKQIAEIDQLTVKYEPISSIDLMERASRKVADWIVTNCGNFRSLWFFAGPGNNGGDALAVARILADSNFNCIVYTADFGKKHKGDPAINFERLKEQNKVPVQRIGTKADIPVIPSDVLVVDGLFGSGLTRPLTGLAAHLIKTINSSQAKVISIDIPSGLLGEDNSENDLSAVIRADYTLTFQFPKISFLFPENHPFTGHWEVLPIGLSAEALNQTSSHFTYLTKELIAEKIQKRDKFSHKGTYGHALLIAGSYGKMGAAVLASRACLRSGVGLLTTHIPRLGYEIIQISVPEAMTSMDESEVVFSSLPDVSVFSAIGIGPGLDKKAATKEALLELLYAKPEKMVLDADALNILAESKSDIGLLPENAILTPHPKEFERLIGASSNSYARLLLQLQFSAQYKAIVLCKGAHSCVTFPDGRVFFNSSGNAGMATGGSGDVLTGIILGLLAQNYSSEDAVLIAVYLHGLAGDFAVARLGQQSMIPGDIIDHMGEAFMQFV